MFAGSAFDLQDQPGGVGLFARCKGGSDFPGVAVIHQQQHAFQRGRGDRTLLLDAVKKGDQPGIALARVGFCQLSVWRGFLKRDTVNIAFQDINPYQAPIGFGALFRNNSPGKAVSRGTVFRGDGVTHRADVLQTDFLA